MLECNTGLTGTLFEHNKDRVDGNHYQIETAGELILPCQLQEIKLDLEPLTSHVDTDEFFRVLENLSNKIADFNFDFVTFLQLCESLELLDKSSREELTLDRNTALCKLIDQLQGWESDRIFDLVFAVDQVK